MSYGWFLKSLLTSALLPPLNGLLLALLGVIFWRKHPRTGRTLVLLGLLLLTALSLGVVSRMLLKPLEERYPPLEQHQLAKLDIEAIVILGGGRYRNPPELSGEDDVGSVALERLRYGALLARQTGKPILLSGGMGGSDRAGRSEAEAMQNALQRDFGIRAQWLEPHSSTSEENALHTAEMLRAMNLHRVALVTQAWHMPRASKAFEAAGLEVVPAPTAFLTRRPLTARDYLPNADAMHESARALHEWIGAVWYAFKKPVHAHQDTPAQAQP